MAAELATIQPEQTRALARYGRPLLTATALVEEGQQRQLLMQYVKAHMIAGTDFGVIPGTNDRKSLLKPGAEKLTELFRCTPEFTIVERTEDWDKPLIHYVIRCRVIAAESGVIVAEGLGSCNSRESKYRYRNGERTCPTCGKPTIINGKKEYGGGFICFAKKGGCGAKFADGDRSITGQTVGKVENPDVADIANTILKMAKKRAHVDAAIALARCSDMFTQDVEDAPQDDPVTARQEPVKPVDTAVLSNELKRTGWSWPRAKKAMNDKDGTAYGDKAMPADIDQQQLGNFLAWLTKEPNKPAVQPDAAPVTGENATYDDIPR